MGGRRGEAPEARESWTGRWSPVEARTRAAPGVGAWQVGTELTG